MTKLPTDDLGHEMQVIGYADIAPQQISFSAASARNTTAFNSKTKVIRLSLDQAAYIKPGDSSVTAGASDHYLPAGGPYDIRINPKTHLAVISAGTDGTCWISELE